jgi:hypothetical protein
MSDRTVRRFQARKTGFRPRRSIMSTSRINTPLDRRRVTGFVLILLVTMTTGLWPHGQRTPAEPGRPPFLTIFLVDGLSQGVFLTELQAGHLPTSKR